MSLQPLGAFLQKRYNNRLILLGGAILCISGVFISSFLKTRVAFIFFYGILFGFGVGLSYFIPLMCGWEWLPNNRGFVSGIVVGGFGFGSFFFGLLAM